MTDEIRIYHIDDPNDAPDRRLSAFPTINPFIPTSLPQYVIPPIANTLYTAMQYYWYSAYQQGFAAQKQQHQQQQQQHQQQLIQQQQLNSNNSSQHQHLHPHHHFRHHQVTSPLNSVTASSSSSSNSTSATSSAGSSAASPVTSTTPASNHNHHNSNSNNHNTNANNNNYQSNNTQRIKPETHQTITHDDNDHQQPRTQHIKKPLNPFMIYMQKQRPEIQKEGKFKESASINRELGKLWRKLSKEEQQPYYDLAEQEKILHAQKYPGWSARDNYANQKKKKKLKLKSISLNGLDQSDKKCRARFGLNNMASWCKPCKRKKKCIYNRPSLHESHLNDCHHQLDQLAID